MRFQLLYLTVLGMTHTFKFSHSGGCEIVFHCGFIFKFCLFIFGCAESLLYEGLLCVRQVGAPLPCMGFPLQWLLSLQSTGSRGAGSSSCSVWTQQLRLAGSGAWV